MTRHFPWKITSGVNLILNIKLENYPTKQFKLKILLRGVNRYGLESLELNKKHHFNINPDVTKTYAKGFYNYAIQAENKNTRDIFEIERGQVEIKPDIDSLDQVDGRTHAQKVLENIEAVIEKRATKDQDNYSISFNGSTRTLARTPIADLLLLRDKYRLEVIKQKPSKTFGKKVRVKF